MERRAINVLQDAVGRCCDDRHCAAACSLRADTAPADLAQAVLSTDIPEKVLASVSTCSHCGLCNEVCPHGVDVKSVMKQARVLLTEQGVLDAECYRHLWVDHDWNIFTLFRARYGLDDGYRDLVKNQCSTLFLPGCTLANMGPELVRSATEWLAAHGEDVGLVLQCCGATLNEMGVDRRSAAYSQALWTQMKRTGATKLVTACPTCYSRLAEAKENDGIAVVSLFQIMADAGVRVPAPGGQRITVHDSCTDRQGQVGLAVREMLRDTPLVEMRHYGQNTICCGSGGLVSAVAPEISEQRARERLKEVDEVEADVCVTYCMTCAHRFSSTERDGGKAIQIRHILELVFGARVDHPELDAKALALFEGEHGLENYGLLQNSKLLA